MNNYFISQDIFAKFETDYCSRQLYNFRKNCSDRTTTAYTWLTYKLTNQNQVRVEKTFFFLARYLSEIWHSLLPKAEVSKKNG